MTLHAFTLAAMSLDQALARHEMLREALLRVASDGGQGLSKPSEHDDSAS